MNKNKADLISQVNTLFATTGVAQHITPEHLRLGLLDIIDSYPNLNDDVSLFGVAQYNPSRTYPTGTVVFNAGLLYVTTEELTGTFTLTKAVVIPLPAVYFEYDEWDASVGYFTNDVVRYNFRLWKSVAGSINIEPGTTADWTELSMYSGLNYGTFVASKVYQDKTRVVQNGAVYIKVSNGFSATISDGWEIESLLNLRAFDLALYTEFVGVSTTVGEKDLSAFLPANAIPIMVSVEIVDLVRGGSNTSANLEVYFGTSYSGGSTVVLAGDVYSSASMRSVPDLDPVNYSTEVTLRITVDAAIAQVDQGELKVVVAYILPQ